MRSLKQDLAKISGGMITGIINSIDTNVDQLVLMKIIRYTSENWASNCKSYDANAAGKLVSIVTKTFNEYQNVSKINDFLITLGNIAQQQSSLPISLSLH